MNNETGFTSHKSDYLIGCCALKLPYACTAQHNTAPCSQYRNLWGRVKPW